MCAFTTNFGPGNPSRLSAPTHFLPVDAVMSSHKWVRTPFVFRACLLLQCQDLDPGLHTCQATIHNLVKSPISANNDPLSGGTPQVLCTEVCCGPRHLRGTSPLQPLPEGIMGIQHYSEDRVHLSMAKTLLPLNPIFHIPNLL